MARAARLQVAGMDEETIDPRIEAVRIAEPRQLAPGDHQRLLNGVLGSIDVAKDAIGDPEKPVTASSGQDAERIAVPALGLLDEIDVHRPPSPRRTGGAVRDY
jgi:hypothetical protein